MVPLKTAKQKGRHPHASFPKIAHERAPRLTFNAEVKAKNTTTRREEKLAAVVVVKE